MVGLQDGKKVMECVMMMRKERSLDAKKRQVSKKVKQKESVEIY